MTDKAENINTNKRRTLQRMLGIGVGLAMPLGPVSHGASLSLPLAAPAQPGGASGIFDVRSFGATGDGKTLDSPAINRAIEAAAAAGGGAVRFPAGTYLCYSIHLKSNVALYLGEGAIILAADTQEGGSGYDPPESNPWDMYQDFGHSHWHNSLIWGVGLGNVSIVGPGLIWGRGLSHGKNERGLGVGNKTIGLENCHNVTMRDFSVLQGGHFGILATAVDSLTIDNLKIDTNRDGMDIDCCQNVRVSNCTVNSPWDDAICLKSSYALGHARATQNVTITNCFVTGGYELGALLDGTFKRIVNRYRGGIGRIKCGTESNGGFQNITISNCVFDDCLGLALETVDGALLEDITISNISMRDILAGPIFMRLGRRMRAPVGTPLGALRRVSISNIVVSNTTGRYASILSGIPGYDIEDVKLSDIYILSQGGGSRENAAILPPEKEKSYPEPIMFGPMPCYGFFIRHVKGIEMSNVEVRCNKEDLRPAFLLNDVKGADFVHIKAQPTPDVPVFALNNVADFSVYLSRPVHDMHLENVKEKKL